MGVDPSLGVAGKALTEIVVVDVKTGDTVVTAGLRDADAVESARAVDILCRKLCGPRGLGHGVVAPESQGIGVSFKTE